MKSKCRKCGSDNIYTRWKKKGDRLWDGVCVLDYDLYHAEAANECLAHVCRGCGFRWTSPTVEQSLAQQIFQGRTA